MKFLLLLVSLIFINNQCVDTAFNQNDISFEYSAMSRGIYNQIIINKKMVSVVKKRGSKPITKPSSEETWNKLIEALKTINIDSISSLKAPSQNRFFDGAAIANLKVIYKDSIYKTPSFDHGNPPQEIAPLVKEMLSISQNIE